ncbi:TPA: DUF4935 domain-containing protein [Stenotrophomonas maltophilia]|nr:DUF4935 domain-containing protein [Stenotrophomonas maltophilia]HDS1043679.1 DUF4935 domain-containing protein [Stenotrophomonas maltophilia]
MELSLGQYVFVDANVWITWGQGFGKAEASTLAELVKHDLVILVTTDLTIMEIAKRFRNNDIAALEPLTKPDLQHAAQRYLKLKVPEFDREALRKSLFEHHMRAVSQDLAERFDAHVRSINSVKPTHILDQYTHGTGLFSASTKKDQFPDAFIFAVISKGVSAKRPLIVWSQDGDFSTACEKAEHITRVTSMPKLLRALGVMPEGEAVIQVFDDNPALFLHPLKAEIEECSIDVYDIDDADAEVLQVLEVVSIEVSALYQIGEGQDRYIGFAECHLRVELSFSHPDWESAMWDSEDKVAIPFHTVEGETQTEIDPFEFSFLADVKDGEIVRIYDCELKGWGLRVALTQDEKY